MASYYRRRDTLQKLRLYEFYVQNTDGSYPVTGSVPYLSGPVGRVGWSGVLIDGSGDMSVPGSLDVGGDLAVDGNAGVSGTLGVGGAAVFGSNVGITGTLGVGGAAVFGSNVGITGTLGVGGAAVFGSNVGITGTLGVGGSTVFGSNVGITGTLGVGGAAVFGSNVGITGTLGVGGNAGVSGNLGVGGNAGVSGNLGVGGNADVSGNLGVDGNLDVSGTSYLRNHLDVKEVAHVHKSLCVGQFYSDPNEPIETYNTGLPGGQTGWIYASSYDASGDGTASALRLYTHDVSGQQSYSQFLVPKSATGYNSPNMMSEYAYPKTATYYAPNPANKIINVLNVPLQDNVPIWDVSGGMRAGDVQVEHRLWVKDSMAAVSLTSQTYEPGGTGYAPYVKLKTTDISGTLDYTRFLVPKNTSGFGDLSEADTLKEYAYPRTPAQYGSIINTLNIPLKDISGGMRAGDVGIPHTLWVSAGISGVRRLKIFDVSGHIDLSAGDAQIYGYGDVTIDISMGTFQQGDTLIVGNVGNGGDYAGGGTTYIHIQNAMPVPMFGYFTLDPGFYRRFVRLGSKMYMFGTV